MDSAEKMENKRQNKGEVHCCTIKSTTKCHLKMWATILKGLTRKFYTISTASQLLKMTREFQFANEWLLTKAEAGQKFFKRSFECQLNKWIFLQNQNNFENLSVMFFWGVTKISNKCKTYNSVSIHFHIQIFINLISV